MAVLGAALVVLAGIGAVGGSAASAGSIVTAKLDGTSADAAVWVGVGLGNSARYPLARSGSDSDGSGHARAWIELYPQYLPYYLTTFGDVTGHVLFAHVTLDLPHYYYTMTSNGGSNGRVLATPGPISPNGYSSPLTWHAAS
jgi:hypothetical protein